MRLLRTVALQVGLSVPLAGCASTDFRAETQAELARHPPQPERRFAAPSGTPAVAPGDWLLYRTHAPPAATHVMEGWERVHVEAVNGPGGRDIRLTFLGQTPYDRVEGSAHLEMSARSKEGYYVIQSGSGSENVDLPLLSSSVSGSHRVDGRVRTAVTPALSEVNSRNPICDEQLLVRVAPLDVGARLMGAASATREDVTVPAGTFTGAVVFSVTAAYFETPGIVSVFSQDPCARHPWGPVKIWLHDQVPATGVVKMVFPGGATLELLDFGRGNDVRNRDFR